MTWIEPYTELKRLALILLCSLIVIGSGTVFGQEPDELTPDMIASRIEAIQGSASLSETAKAQAVQHYEQARDAMSLRDGWKAKVEEYRQKINDAPDVLASTNEEIEMESQYSYEVPADKTLSELELLLSQEEAELADLRSQLTEAQSRPNQRSERRRVIPEQTTTARAALSEITELRNASPVADAAEEVRTAHRVWLDAREQSRQAEIQAYEWELQSYDARGQLLARKIVLLSRKVANQEQTVAALSGVVTAKRDEEFQRTADQIREINRELGVLPPIVRAELEAMLARNTELIEELSGSDGVLKRIDQRKAETAGLIARRESLEEEREQMELVLASGATAASGRLLRVQGEKLPNVQTHRRNISQRNTRIANVGLSAIQMQDEWQELIDPEEVVERKIDSFELPEDFEERDRLEEALTDLLTARSSTLSELELKYGELRTALGELDVAERAYVEEVEAYGEFVAERVLFIRSGTWPHVEDATTTFRAFQWLVDYRGWLETLRSTWNAISFNALAYTLGLLVVLLMLVLRYRLRQALEDAGKEASKKSCTRIDWTFRALLATAGLAIPVPLLMYLVGRAVAAGFPETELNASVGASLMATGIAITPLMLIRVIMRHDGLAPLHFGWPEDLSASVRRVVLVVIPIFATLSFLVMVFENSYDDDWRETAGRFCFLLMTLLILRTVIRLVRGDNNSLYSKILVRLGLDRRPYFGKFLRFVMVGAPVVLVLATISGYYYTAFRLTENLYLTAVLVVTAVLMASIANRWVQLAHRRLAREQARQKLKLLKAQQEKSGEEVVVPDDEFVNLKAVDQQAGRLIRAATVGGLLVGMWFIWADMVPALEVLNQIEIGHTSEVVPGLDSGAESEGAAELTRQVPVTLRHLLTALLIVLLTVAATQNIPGLLELTVLQRLSLAAGERYAVTSITRYLLGVIGLLVAFNSVGIGWGRVQWLVAALSVGLGFGLQEIVANFVSGLILLFERPIRIGDTVTVGGIHGTVSKIRIRATTITDFDRKDLVVPNKEFVTQQLVNWTLSDSILRVIIPVGLSYDGDIDLAVKTLLEVAKKNPLVLDDPKPDALFLGFGDSTLNFELRVHCASMPDYIPMRHQLHMAITKAFREQGLEIAYPQRDLHLRSSDIELYDKRTGRHKKLDSEPKSGKIDSE